MNPAGTQDSVSSSGFLGCNSTRSRFDVQLALLHISNYFLPVIFASRLPDEWGSITVDHKELLDGGSLWSVLFDDYSMVARAGGAPLIEVSRDAATNGVVSIHRVTEAASPVVHRILITAASALDSTGSFEMSLEGVVTRPISVGVSAYHLQNVSVVFTACLGSDFSEK